MGRNFTWRIGSQAVSSVINLVAMVLLGRHLAARGYGEYAFWYALIPVIANFTEAGIGIVVSREIARTPARAAVLLGDALLMRAAIAGIVLGGILPALWLLMPHGERALVAVVVASSLLDFSQDLAVWVVRGFERLELEAVLLVLSQVVWIAGIWLSLRLDASLVWLLGSAAVAFALRTAFGLWIVVRRICAPRFAPDRARWTAILRDGLPFGLAMFGSALYGRVGLLLLRGLATPEDVARFQVGFLLSQPFGFIAVALSVSMFPGLARCAQTGGEPLRRLVRRATRYALLLALPLGLGLGVLADPMVALLFKGRGFAQAADALRLSSLAIPPIFLNLLSRYVLAALDRQRAYLHAILTGAIVNGIIGLILIPSLGYRGACLAYLAAELSIAVVCQRALAPHLGFPALVGESARPFAAAALTGAALLLLHRLPPVVLVALCGISYAALLPAVGAVSSKELRTLRQVCLSFAGNGGRA